MKKQFIIFLFFIPVLCVAQIDLGLQIGMNYPINYTSNVLARELGIELGVNVGKSFKNNFGFESGILVEVFGRMNSDIYATIENTAFLKFQLFMPILVSYKCFNDKMNFKLGTAITAKNILTITNYSGFDPEAQYTNDEFPQARHIGIDFYFGAEFKLSQRFGVLANFRTPIDIKRLQDYGIVSIGLNYKIIQH